jgi:hypothetical protein
MTALGVMQAANWFWPPYACFLTIEMFRTRSPAGAIRMNVLSSSSCQDGHRFVRLSFNGRPLELPECASAGDHLCGNKAYCTLVSSS